MVTEAPTPYKNKNTHNMHLSTFAEIPVTGKCSCRQFSLCIFTLALSARLCQIYLRACKAGCCRGEIVPSE